MKEENNKKNRITIQNTRARKVKILIVIPSLNIRSGVASHVMNYYREIYEAFDIDFATYTVIRNDNTREILKNGGKIFYFKKDFFGNWRLLKNFFKEHAKEYDIIHCHTFNYGVLYLFFAKKYGIDKRIIHMHSVRYSDNIFKCALNYLFVLVCLKLANVYVACSKQTGKKAFRNRPFTVINNGIEISKFSVNDSIRKKYRKKLGVKNGEFLLGNVGKISRTKNQVFAIKVLKELRKNYSFKDGKFVIIGFGPKKAKLLNYIKKYNLENNVIILSNIRDVSGYYAAMDCFIFPSLCEGLGIALLEAQASGLPCFCSDNLPEEVFATNLVCGLSLKSGEKVWSEKILHTDLTRRNVKEQLLKAGFDIKQDGKKIYNFYCSLDERKK